MIWTAFGLLVAAAVVAVADARAVPAEPLSIVMGPNGAPILMMRAKRQPVAPYPHRAMMFSGYYRPIRRSDGPATGVFAQGNAVSGGSYLGGNDPNYLQSGPEPADEPEVSSSEAEAAPETGIEEEQGPYSDGGDDEAPQQVEPQQQDEVQPYATEAPVADEQPPQTAVAKRPAKAHKPSKQNKKTTVHIESDEEVDEDEESDEQGSSPFVPFSANRRGNMPNLNNFFPMVFSFPRSSGRGGQASGSPPGMITAIANSYSTGKGGVASSVATAYGGSPSGKKKRAKSSQE